MSKIKSPINWYGGKYYMKDKLISLFPEHKTYIEGFGGAMHVMLAKDKSNVDVYNDLHNGLYLFFKTLRGDNRDELISKIQLSPHSRQEFYECRDSWENETDEIEKARKFYVKTMQSFSGIGQSWSYSKNTSRRGMSQATSKYLGNVNDNLINVIDRLMEIQIENLDIIELINKYDSHDTFFYLDPPYVSEERVSDKVYDNEMATAKHIELVDKLISCKSKVMLSGYDNNIYDVLTSSGWIKINIGDYNHRNGDSANKKRVTKDEFVWINYNIE